MRARQGRGKTDPALHGMPGYPSPAYVPWQNSPQGRALLNQYTAQSAASTAYYQQQQNYLAEQARLEQERSNRQRTLYWDEHNNAVRELDSQAREMGITKQHLAKLRGFNSEREALAARAYETTQRRFNLMERASATQMMDELRQNKFAGLESQMRDENKLAYGSGMARQRRTEFGARDERIRGLQRETIQGIGLDRETAEQKYAGDRVGFREAAAGIDKDLGLIGEAEWRNRNTARESLRIARERGIAGADYNAVRGQLEGALRSGEMAQQAASERAQYATQYATTAMYMDQGRWNEYVAGDQARRQAISARQKAAEPSTLERTGSWLSQNVWKPVSSGVNRGWGSLTRPKFG